MLKHIMYRLSAVALSLSLAVLPGCTEIGNVLAPLWGAAPAAPQGGSSGVRLEPVRSEVGQRDTVADMKVVSGEYRAFLTQTDAGDTAIVRIPIDRGQLPEKPQDAVFQPERYEGGRWVPTGSLTWYDSGAGEVVFRQRFQVTTPTENLQIAQAATAAPMQFRIRIYLLSNIVTSLREGSHFRIHYYPPHLDSPHRVKSDAEWGHSAAATGVPAFIADLDLALNDAYQKLRQQPRSGGVVFAETPVQDVYVCNTGGDAGDSPLGGPMRISNTRITSPSDLKLTATHELVHVLQGQYYTMQGLFTGRYNHWFIEAVANYYAATVNGLDDAGKKAFYGEFFSDYLSVPLSSNLDNSMYAAGHFLDWLSQRYGAAVVGDALTLSSGNDLIGLSKAIQQLGGEEESLSKAYEAYMEAVVTRPEDTANFHQAIRDAMGSHALGNSYLSSPILNDKRTWATLSKTLNPYAAVLSSLRLNNSDDALLVVETDGSTGALLKNRTYPLSATQNSAYASLQPLDAYHGPTTGKFWTLPHVGQGQKHTQIEQLMFNSSAASAAKAASKFYLLRPPVILSQTETELTWDLSSLGNIPKEQIQGFRIYRVDDQERRIQLLPLQIMQPGKTTQTIPVTPEMFVEGTPLVTVVDKWNNEWPASDEPAGDALQCYVVLGVRTYESTPDTDGRREVCTGNCRPMDGSVSEVFDGAFQGDVYTATRNLGSRWNEFFTSYNNLLSFRKVDQGRAIEGLQVRLEGTYASGVYRETLNVDGRLDRVSTSPLVYRMQGDQVCQAAAHTGNNIASRVCDGGSYVTVTCKPPVAPSAKP